MRVLVNTTNLVKGGALQVAAAFVREALSDPQGVDWRFALSPQVARDAERLAGRPIPQAAEFATSPARHRPTRDALLELERRLAPDAVFSIFGPAYVPFRRPHLMGCATPWVTNSTWLSYSTLPTVRERVHMWAWSKYCARWLRAADAWVTESPAVKLGMQRRLGLPADQIAVVPNTCSQPYFAQAQRTPFPHPETKVRLLCFSAPYPHKCLDLIPAAARELARRAPRLDFEFVVTLPPGDPLWLRIDQQAKRFGVARRVVNRGPVPVADGPELYRSCHVCFMPTVLECFTATYPEAWAMGLPVVTSDLDFARGVCGEAALYFQPKRAASAAEQVLTLLSSSTLWNQVTERGRAALAQLPTPQDRYARYVKLLCDLAAPPVQAAVSPLTAAPQQWQRAA